MKGVFVVGAGPAGIFAARQIALAGFDVCLFNRDIKPGGLAEYGIYPTKDKMKFGLRKQFAKVLEMPNVHYFGHVQVGKTYGVTIEELEAMRPAAMVFACGAQASGKLGLPGEDAKGVYAAKDFVYNYNLLPPYTEMDFSTGKRAAIIGMGNVAIDIAHWLLQDSPYRELEEVMVLARRGPMEAKFDEKEIQYVDHHIARDRLTTELERVKERCARCNQDVSPDKLFEEHFRRLKDPAFAFTPPRLTFRFLTSPTAVLKDETGRIAQIEVAENDLVLREDGSTKSVMTKERTILDVDTLVFAIGDKQDPNVGLPMGPHGYATGPETGASEEPSFQVWNPETDRPLAGRFVVGWARRASTGLVGIARHDGELGANEAIEYVKNAPESNTMGASEVLARLEQKGLRPVTKDDLALLGRAEEREAAARQVSAFKYADNDAMFKAIAEEQEQAEVVRA
jgi:ferredoxin/flavodoxin---NADP+ reductase